MVSGVGRTPPFPSKETDDFFKHLANALKTHLGDFHEDINEIMKSPHLADSRPAMESLAQTIDNLDNLSNQAARLE